MNTKRIPTVEEAIDWAYRQGYAYARVAADHYTRATDSAFTIGDLGMYGDKLVFHDSPEDAQRAVDGSTYPGQHRKADS